MSIDALVNPQDEDDCMQDGTETVVTADDCNSSGEETDDESVSVIPNFKAQLHAVAVLRQVAYFSDALDRLFLVYLRRLQSSVRAKRASTAKQTTLDSYLN